MIIKVDPLDTLFFRDGKPFSMGSDSWANSVFPPYPSVFYGALRSTYFSEHIHELKMANTPGDPTKNLKITGIYFLIQDEIYLPLPYDCVQEKDTSNESAFCLPLVSQGEVKTSSPVHHYLKSKTPLKKIKRGLLPINSLKEYLSGTGSEIPFCKIPDCVMIEPKIGISINRETGSAEKTKLYNADFLRLETEKNQNFSLIISFEGLDLPKKGMMKLGGEGKAVRYEEFTTLDPSITIPQHDVSLFKLYLSTPAVFNKGWIPEWIDEKTLIGKYNDLQLELLTASMGKPLHIGGFDIKAGRPKPMRKAVPAGSVYYFKILDGTFQKAYYEFNHTALSDYNAEQGFGISYVGVIHDQ